MFVADRNLPVVSELANGPAVCENCSHLARREGRKQGPASGTKRRGRTAPPPNENERSMPFDAVDLHCLWCETNRRLDELARRVRGGDYLQEALEFAQFVFWSGLVKLFKAHPAPAPLQVDSVVIESKIKELQYGCRQWLMEQDKVRSSKLPTFTRAEITRLNDKLDMIAGYLSKLPVAFDAPVTPRNTDVSVTTEMHERNHCEV